VKYSDEQQIEKIRETTEKLQRYLKETGITRDAVMEQERL